ncbi:MAG: MotA/TolQ/ExbB proton channel family protein [Gammaproteobacteria bacterium]|nr:MotA/TolQ/ExbB proton channel family protein [Gammaproteobacteria bacterium]
MDLATLIGLLAGAALVAVAIALGPSVTAFVDVPSLLIVVGGAVSATMMRFPLRQCFGAFRTALSKAFREQVETPMELIKAAQHLAEVARKSGLISLEKETVANEMLARGVRMAVDGRDAEHIREVLSKEINTAIERSQMGERIFRALGDSAPAFGMIGTLVGLVQMLTNLSDPKSIGPAMAVALLTTLYGAVLANLVFMPIADKLQARALDEANKKALILHGVLGIQRSLNPRVLYEQLEAYLPRGQGDAQQPEARGGAPSQTGKAPGGAR